MYKIKERPEDFVVEEQIHPELDEGGQYAYFWLRKRGYTTQRALQKITGFVKKKLRDAGFAGNKDKQAVTKQAISIKDPKNRLGGKSFEVFGSDDLQLEYIGRGKKPISLGDLDGNRFEIILRECDGEPKRIAQVVNYFDEQRFSGTNVAVGRAILKGDFRKACELIDAKDVADHLNGNPNDFVGAMKQMPLKIRLLHVHAYQSWLWNDAVSQYLQCKYKVVKQQYSLGELCFPQEEIAAESVPIVGFGTELGTDEISRIIKRIMKREEMVQRDFVIKAMPELTAEGGKREIAVDIKDLAIEKIGEKKYKIRFLLPKGSYATMAVKQMFV